MTPTSAGVLLHRPGETGTEVLLVHPGGPFWRRKDVGAWQIPKGMIAPGEDAAAAAWREVAEELGLRLTAPLDPLGTIRQRNGKIVVAFAAAEDFDTGALASNSFEIEWPPHSGRMAAFPEVDAARWMPLAEAEAMMLPSQRPLLTMLREHLAGCA